MTAAARLLDKFDRVKQTRPGHWIAGCPCCQSRQGRPISVRETDDGRVLLHAFCGCENGTVLAALGLTLSDLFDKPIGHHIAPSHSRIRAADVLACVSADVDLVAVIAADFVDRKTISESTWHQLAQAAARLGAARGLIA